MADTQTCASGEPGQEMWSQESRQSCKYDAKMNCFGLGAIEFSAAHLVWFFGRIALLVLARSRDRMRIPRGGSCILDPFSLARLTDSVCEIYVVYIVG